VILERSVWRIMNKTNDCDKYDGFIRQYEELCIKTGITISHEDTQGSFILESFNSEDLEWVKDAKRK
jgi:hypothetical protein